MIGSRLSSGYCQRAIALQTTVGRVGARKVDYAGKPNGAGLLTKEGLRQSESPAESASRHCAAAQACPKDAGVCLPPIRARTCPSHERKLAPNPVKVNGKGGGGQRYFFFLTAGFTATGFWGAAFGAGAGF
jgi:hypothetical protein